MSLFRKCFKGFILSFVICLLFSCGVFRRPLTVHLHDRHRLSGPVFAGIAATKPGGTLVLLDYHHDCSVDPADDGSIASYDWAGRLLESSAIDRIIWLSGRTLLEPNRESRMHWLNRSLERLPPSRARAILDRIELVDFHDLESRTLSGPLFVSLDLDVLTIDPGPDPAAFLDELLQWIQAQRAELLTVAFSAVYQKSPRDAWSWLVRSVKFGNRWKWILEAEGPAGYAESEEELRAWERWNSQPVVWRNPDEAFYPGESLWTHAPLTVRSALVDSGVTAGDAAAERVISGWKDTALSRLYDEFPSDRMESFAKIVRNTALSVLNKNNEQTLSFDEQGYLELPETLFSPDGKNGVAVRFLSGGIDRGCLAIWRGIDDFDPAVSWCATGALNDPRYPSIRSDELDQLEIELSIFGPWEVMDHPQSFRPGVDSILLESSRGATLLQASLARDRQYDDVSFLQTISAKAGIGRDGWKDESIRLYRAVTRIYRIPFGNG